MGKLYLVATPIGNLDDITIRALKILFTVHGIACEDTRKTGQMMKILRLRYEKFLVDEVIDIPDQRLISYYEQNEFKRLPDIITALKNGLDIALVSDAGTPAISDPGFRLVYACVKAGIEIVPIPGASSVISSLIASGLPTDSFLFLGYPPIKEGKRKQLYGNLKEVTKKISTTIVLFEAPHKLLGTLNELNEILGDIEIVIARELTKIHEEFQRSTVTDLIKTFEGKKPKGEYVILFHL